MTRDRDGRWAAARRWLGRVTVPSATTVAVTLVLAGVTPLFLGGTGRLVAAAGGVVVVGGTVLGTRGLVAGGTVLALGGVALTGADGGVAALDLLVATTTALLAWDAGRYGFTVASQLGRSAPTVRIVVAHTAASAAAAFGATAVGYAAYLGVDGRGSFTAFVLLLVGVGLATAPFLGSRWTALRDALS